MGLRSLLVGDGRDARATKVPEKKPNVNNDLPPFDIQIYSHNIRQDADRPVEHEKPWHVRRDGVCASIHYTSKSNPTLVGLQEVKQNQLHDILFGLGSEWSYFGVGRDDGKTQGEITPILYKATEWDLLHKKVLWLSETPEKPSRGWDAACNRTITVITVKHKLLKKVVHVFNTHFDHKGRIARLQSSKLVSRLLESYGGTCILCGDLNSQVHEEAYKSIKAPGLVDASVSCGTRTGFKHTNTGFTPDGDENTIDFIFISDGKPRTLEVLANEYDSYRFSDHRPVTTIVLI